MTEPLPPIDPKDMMEQANAQLYNIAAMKLLEIYEGMRKVFGAEKAYECVGELEKVAKKMAMLERKNKIWTPSDTQQP